MHIFLHRTRQMPFHIHTHKHNKRLDPELVYFNVPVHVTGLYEERNEDQLIKIR